ncbi:MAG: MFS transporter [Caloramator sp.]|nr:MFS transporter [Caloramator sp.]
MKKKSLDNNALERLNLNRIKNITNKSIVKDFLIFNFIIGFGAGLVVPYFNIYLKYKAHIETDKVGVLMAFSTLAMALGSLITPKLALKFGKARTLIISQLISIPFLILMTNTENKMIFYTSFILRSGFMNMSMPLAINLAMDIVEIENKHIMSSLINLFANLSRAISAAIGGYIIANYRNGYELPYFITALLYIFALIFAYRKILPNV